MFISGTGLFIAGIFCGLSVSIIGVFIFAIINNSDGEDK